MVRASSLAKLRPWFELTAQNGDGGGSCIDDFSLAKAKSARYAWAAGIHHLMRA